MNRIQFNSRARASAFSVIGSAAAVALVLAGCSPSEDSIASSSSESSTVTPDSTATAASADADVVTLAAAFMATLDSEQLEALSQDYTFANASNWSNFPNDLLANGPGANSGSGRIGLQTDSLTDEQWTALENLLAAVTGSSENEGFDEIIQHLEADNYLADNGGGDAYGEGQFFIAFLGEPSDTGTWELQFGGHHLALSNTYTDGVLAGATPSFRGIEPFTTVEVDGDTVVAEQQEQEAFAALLASLSADQLSAATLSSSFNDLLLGPGEDWAFPETSEGLKGSDLTDEQKDLLLAAINTYVDDVDDASAAAILAEYESELDDTYIAFSGTTNMTEIGDYIRIDGPSVWIEFSQQGGIVLDGAHPHAVWRDKTNDYGGLTS